MEHFIQKIVSSETISLVLGIVAVIFLATSFVSFYPLYVPCKIGTVKKDQQ